MPPGRERPAEPSAHLLAGQGFRVSRFVVAGIRLASPESFRGADGSPYLLEPCRRNDEFRRQGHFCETKPNEILSTIVIATGCEKVEF